MERALSEPAAPVAADSVGDPRAPRRGDRLIALALALATAAALGFTERAVGFVRDEGYYFRAAELYTRWYRELWAALSGPGRLSHVLSDGAIARAFEYNHEHPILTKALFGLSHHLFTNQLGWLRDAAGYRLPAWGFAGLISALLYLMTSRLVSRPAGVVAVLAFWLTPRHFFHGHLAAFDVPIVFGWLLVVWCYWRSLSSTRWAVATGVAWGVALSIKHNAWIIPGVLLVHALLSEVPRRWRERGPAGAARALAPFGAMALLGPLVFWAHWPWLWHRPIERLLWYVAFHGKHINYPWEYYGRLLVEAPFPVGYAFGLTAVTVPLSLLVPMATGSLREMARFVATYLWRPLERRVGALDPDSLLVLGNGFASLVVFSVPHIPIFGGVKHWMPSMPFLCILAVGSLDRAAAALATRWPRLRAATFPALAALVLAPALAGVVHNHPYGTSFYNELAGGYPGGASLGMHRQYWSNNVTGVLDWLNANAPQNARVFLHEVNWDSFAAYQRAGMLREDIQYANGPTDSQISAYQYMPEFRDVEFQIWDEYGTRIPVHGLYLDETPQVVIYRRPGT